MIMKKILGKMNTILLVGIMIILLVILWYMGQIHSMVYDIWHIV